MPDNEYKARDARMYKAGLVTFKPSEAEQREYAEFVDLHMDSCPVPKSPTKEKIAFTVVPNGLGVLLSVKCLACGEVKDITDTENW